MGSSWLAALASVMLMSGLVIEGANAPAALSGAASVATTQAAQPHARRELGFCSPAASLRKLRAPPAVTAAHAIPGLHPVVARSPPAIMAALDLLDPGSVGGFLGAGLRLSASDLLHRSRVHPARSRGPLVRGTGALGLSSQMGSDAPVPSVPSDDAIFVKVRLILLRSPMVEWWEGEDLAEPDARAILASLEEVVSAPAPRAALCPARSDTQACHACRWCGPRRRGSWARHPRSPATGRCAPSGAQRTRTARAKT